MKIFGSVQHGPDIIEISALPCNSSQKIFKRAIDMLVLKELVEVVDTKSKPVTLPIDSKFSDPVPHKSEVPVIVIKRSSVFYERLAMHKEAKINNKNKKSGHVDRMQNVIDGKLE